MRIEIFVVLNEFATEKASMDEYASLETLKYNCARIFGGLTETNEEKGYWDLNGQIFSDNVKRWLIYVNDGKINRNSNQIGLGGLIQVGNLSIAEILVGINKTIKNLTHQTSQAYGIDGKLFFV